MADTLKRNIGSPKLQARFTFKSVILFRDSDAPTYRKLKKNKMIPELVAQD